MKIIALTVLVLAGVALSQQQDSDYEAHRKKIHEMFEACVKESGVDPELPKKAFKEGQFPDDKNLKCFMKCMLQKNGRMDSNGNIDYSNAANHVPPNVDKAKITAAIEKCKNSKGADACETAYLAVKCFRENVGPLPEHSH